MTGVSHTPNREDATGALTEQTSQKENEMANPNNHGNLIGRPANKPKEFPNDDGSIVLLFDLMAEENFLRGGKREADAIPCRVFIPKEVGNIGSWRLVGKGDLIAIGGSLSRKRYMKSGENTWTYPAMVFAVDGYPELLEPKSVTEQRAAKYAAEGTSGATSSAAATPQPVAAPVAENVDPEIAELERRIAAKKAAAAGAADASESPFGG